MLAVEWEFLEDLLGSTTWIEGAGPEKEG